MNYALLLIDDSASVREVLRVAFESAGHQVLEAADGREGVRLYREHRPALAIVDIVMPEKDGIEAATKTTFGPKASTATGTFATLRGEP
jgi:CheY-like chemotaxis protein